MIINYTFSTDDGIEVEYEYKPSDAVLLPVAKEFCAENTEDMAEYNLNPNNDADCLTFAYECSDFEEYAAECLQDEAREACFDDPDTWETIAETREYHRDPYAYYGVSRSDFC